MVEFIAGQADIGAGTRRDRGHRGRRQLFLGAAAFAEQAGLCADSRGAGEVGGGDIGGSRPHVVEDELIYCVAGELGVPHRRSDLLKVGRGVRQGHAGSARAEIAQGDDAAGSEPGCGAQRGERGRGVGDQNRRHTAPRQIRLGEELVTQRGGLGLGPIRGDRDDHRCPVADGACHRLDRFDRQCRAEILRPVGRHQRSPVADPLDESPQHQPRLGQLRILFRQTDFGWPVLE